MVKFTWLGIACSFRLANTLHHHTASIPGAQLVCPSHWPIKMCHYEADLFDGLYDVIEAPHSSTFGPELTTMQTDLYDSHKNICIDGHLFPELYLLGMPKTASSFLATILRHMGLKSNVEPIKESKFFSWLAYRKKGLTKPMHHLEKIAWSLINPLCNSSKRTVVADYTPEYLMMTPLAPEYSNPLSTQLQKSPSFDYLYGYPGTVDLPMVLTKFYGDTFAPRLKFVVGMREPLSQLQSAYYFTRKVQHWVFKRNILAINAEQFVKFLQQSVNRSLKGPEISNLLYAKHLEGFLKYFSPNQFYMIPYRFVFHQNWTLREEVVRGIFMRLGIWPSKPMMNLEPKLKIEHPTLESSVPPELIADFQKLILPRNKELIKILAKMSIDGAGLALYHGELGSELEIQNWLESGW